MYVVFNHCKCRCIPNNAYLQDIPGARKIFPQIPIASDRNGAEIQFIARIKMFAEDTMDPNLDDRSVGIGSCFH